MVVQSTRERSKRENERATHATSRWFCREQKRNAKSTSLLLFTSRKCVLKPKANVHIYSLCAFLRCSLDMLLFNTRTCTRERHMHSLFGFHTRSYIFRDTKFCRASVEFALYSMVVNGRFRARDAIEPTSREKTRKRVTLFTMSMCDSDERRCWRRWGAYRTELALSLATNDEVGRDAGAVLCSTIMPGETIKVHPYIVHSRDV